MQCYLLSKINNVQSFWKWIAHDFLSNLREVKTSANSETPGANFDLYLNNTASILVGYPMLRQLRVKNGILEIG